MGNEESERLKSIGKNVSNIIPGKKFILIAIDEQIDYVTNLKNRAEILEALETIKQNIINGRG